MNNYDIVYSTQQHLGLIFNSVLQHPHEPDTVSKCHGNNLARVQPPSLIASFPTFIIKLHTWARAFEKPATIERS